MRKRGGKHILVYGKDVGPLTFDYFLRFDSTTEILTLFEGPTKKQIRQWIVDDSRDFSRDMEEYGFYADVAIDHGDPSYQS